jgi:hypothetical protein
VQSRSALPIGRPEGRVWQCQKIRNNLAIPLEGGDMQESRAQEINVGRIDDRSGNRILEKREMIVFDRRLPAAAAIDAMGEKLEQYVEVARSGCVVNWRQSVVIGDGRIGATLEKEINAIGRSEK